MGLYEQAVDWSLEVNDMWCKCNGSLHYLRVTGFQINDLELSRIYAEKPEEDDTLRRRLWLRIARYVIEKKQDIKQYVFGMLLTHSPAAKGQWHGEYRAIEFLRLSQLLKIEDILPFFPDFVLIDDFKEEICAALEDYNTHIESLKAEMDEATKSAESIRQDIRELRNRWAAFGHRQRTHRLMFYA